jgi:hypothetical protein
MLDPAAGRLPPIRRRVARAKAGFVVAGAVLFGAVLALARAHNPGHAKPHLRPLAPTPRYFAEVRKSVGEPGVIHPPVSSPAAATGQS